ncbi:MAG: LamG-like jellyroll fold domain-containing protein, partial [Actinomadura sp.]
MRASVVGAASLAAAKAMPTAYGMPVGVTTGAAPSALPPYVGAGSTAQVRPFQLYDVTLGNGLFQEKRDRMTNFLRTYDERRFLVLFNTMAGRPSPPDVTVPGGWEDGGQLSGHWTGHYLTALAQAYADQGEAVYKDKLDWMVGELAACQDAITARIDNPPDPGDTEPPPIERDAGRFGNALRLGGESSAQYVSLPQETAAQLADLTIAAWVNLAGTQSWARLFDFGQDTAVNMFLTPRAGVSGEPPRFAITVGGSGAEQQITGGSALPIGEWVHLAVTLAGGTGTLYVNGQVAGTNTGMTLDGSDLGNPGNVWIGRSQYSDPFLNASIDEFHVFNRGLSQAEVQSLLDSPAGTTGGGNIAWYRFDKDGGPDAVVCAAQDRAGSPR